MEQRIEKCVKKIKAEALDALLVSNSVNITYLTGFRKAEGYLLLTSRQELFYFTNFLYQEEARKIGGWKVIVSNGTNIFKLLSQTIKREHLRKIGFEAKELPFLEYRKIKDDLGARVDFLATIDLMANLRAVKTKYEISLIKKSVKISGQAFEFIREIYSETMSEKDISIEVEKFLKLKGDSELAFPPIVATGESTAFPHHFPGEKKINGNFFLIDLGSKYCGYCSDLTRVFSGSKMPSLFKKIYDIVRSAQDLAIKKIKEGIKAKEIDRQARAFIEKKGWGKYFGHGLGHGVGLSVHEPPYLNHKNDEVLKEGMVLTIEPAIYIKGKFGIRLEDMVLVKKERSEVLSGNVHR
ncbi:MAG: Xaa-Pro peptidase family protein [Candidatus Omnitrophica bacterium]|nr:Xaa-Pro peptidase family protein [Candidatus Omnitrophota bacterium]MBU1134736.1 Xaa-Pro peptidase family protein [Candidatus Omnitrophota bacterium]MBU1524207.1 Xaa-Pro peptidase family protein [Candidatus Omnitrophota bacterium]MBU1809694.1 Xaa-Pro peptidase family protein [Candidatus Omnitrophota bacterium]MBU2504742.1 Xaa-Pro peptidase family protein [Candidatus Omnitrophota bacterium]